MDEFNVSAMQTNNPTTVTPPPLPPSVSAMQTNNPTTVTPPPLPPSDDGEPNHEFLRLIPAGWRFKPTSEEIILEYLTKKIKNEVLPPSLIHTVNLYAFTPDQLSEKFRASGENEWYFFTSRDRKYKNGHRPSRAAGDGYWKPQKKEDIMHNGEIIGESRNLTYHKGPPTEGVRTFWLMSEFRVNASSTTQVNTMRLDDWVVCKLYKKQNSSPDGSGSTVDENVNATQEKIKQNSSPDGSGSGSTGDENENVMEEKTKRPRHSQKVQDNATEEKIRRPRHSKKVKDGETNNDSLSMKRLSNATPSKSPSFVDVSLKTVDVAPDPLHFPSTYDVAAPDPLHFPSTYDVAALDPLPFPSTYDVAAPDPLPFPYNMSRLGLPFGQNRVRSAINGEGTNKAVMQLHGESSYPVARYGEGTNKAAMQLRSASSYPIPVASFSSLVVDQPSLSSHHHQQQVHRFAYESTNVMTTPSDPFQLQVTEKTQNGLDYSDLFLDVDGIWGSGSDL